MNSAANLFEIFKSFKTAADAGGSSSQQRLLEYCRQVLGAVERMHVDYKQKHDRRTPNLADSDKKNLAKAVSGFANSGGGILIWGIEDDSLALKPIANVQKFLSNALELSSQITDPVVQGIDGEWFPSEENPNEGLAIIYIPESMLPPHRVILNQSDVKNNYYIRSGESFVVASHTQLEDMFGRRPKPRLELSIRLAPAGSTGKSKYFRLLLGIKNTGRGTAKSPFLAIKVHPPYNISKYGIDGNLNFGLPMLVKSTRSEYDKYGASSNIVIHPGITHDVTAVKLKIDWPSQPSEIQDLIIDYQIAAEGIQLIEARKIITGSELLAQCQKMI